MPCTPPVLRHAVDDHTIEIEDEKRVKRHSVKTGPLGFEPRNGETKTRCLTAWRRPNKPINSAFAEDRRMNS